MYYNTPKLFDLIGDKDYIYSKDRYHESERDIWVRSRRKQRGFTLKESNGKAKILGQYIIGGIITLPSDSVFSSFVILNKESNQKTYVNKSRGLDFCFVI